MPSGNAGTTPIDDPGMAQPSTAPFERPEAGSRPGLIDTPTGDSLPPGANEPSGEDEMPDGNIGLGGLTGAPST